MNKKEKKANFQVEAANFLNEIGNRNIHKKEKGQKLLDEVMIHERFYWN